MTEPQLADIMTSETDESLMRENLLQCYGQKTLAFRVSKEHYLYLTEQIISLREHFKRLAAFRLESGGEISETMVRNAGEVIYQRLAVGIEHARSIARAALETALKGETRNRRNET